MPHKVIDMNQAIGDVAGTATAITGATVFTADLMGWLHNINTGIEYVDLHTGFFSIMLMAIGLIVQFYFKRKSFNKDK